MNRVIVYWPLKLVAKFLHAGRTARIADIRLGARSRAALFIEKGFAALICFFVRYFLDSCCVGGAATSAVPSNAVKTLFLNVIAVSRFLGRQ
jgi:hypothetical protein